MSKLLHSILTTRMLPSHMLSAYSSIIWVTFTNLSTVKPDLPKRIQRVMLVQIPLNCRVTTEWMSSTHSGTIFYMKVIHTLIVHSRMSLMRPSSFKSQTLFPAIQQPSLTKKCTKTLTGTNGLSNHTTTQSHSMMASLRMKLFLKTTSTMEDSSLKVKSQLVATDLPMS